VARRASAVALRGSLPVPCVPLLPAAVVMCHALVDGPRVLGGNLLSSIVVGVFIPSSAPEQSAWRLPLVLCPCGLLGLFGFEPLPFRSPHQPRVITLLLPSLLAPFSRPSCAASANAPCRGCERTRSPLLWGSRADPSLVPRLRDLRRHLPSLDLHGSSFTATHLRVLELSLVGDQWPWRFRAVIPLDRLGARRLASANVPPRSVAAHRCAWPRSPLPLLSRVPPPLSCASLPSPLLSSRAHRSHSRFLLSPRALATLASEDARFLKGGSPCGTPAELESPAAAPTGSPRRPRSRVS